MSDAALAVLTGGTLRDHRGAPALGEAAAAAPRRAGPRRLGRPLRDGAAATAAPARSAAALGCRDGRSTGRCRAGATACRPGSSAATSARGSSKRCRRSRPSSGFEAASVKELIAAAGLSPQAFYDIFASKEEAWAAAFEDAFSQLYLTGVAGKLAAGRPDDPGRDRRRCLSGLPGLRAGARAAAAYRRAVGWPRRRAGDRRGAARRRARDRAGAQRP